MGAYQAPAAQIARATKDNEARLVKAATPLLDAHADFIWPKQMHYRSADVGRVYDMIEQLRQEQKAKTIPGKTGPRFILSCDGNAFAGIDLKTGEAFKGETLADLPAYYDFLQPMVGVERYVPPAEQQADVDAARIMRELHDAIIARDSAWGRADRAEVLNTFMTRLLFCLFADSAGVFDRPAGAGHSEVKSPFKRLLLTKASAKDGSTTRPALQAAFRTLDMPDNDPRRTVEEPLVRALPYANGRLFEDDLEIPTFDRRARYALRRALDLDWSGINADIFGSMIQAIASDGERSHFGMHYTSVPNIMKVIGPLFVDELREQLATAGNDRRRLQALVDRVAGIHVLDPACGSGNFLIIAYRELRAIETEALRRLAGGRRDATLRSRMRLDHFHGIDPVDFSCRTARLSLWISQIQADRRLADTGIEAEAILPLHDAGDIRHGSALTIDWWTIIGHRPNWNDKNGSRDGRHHEFPETYIVGNPPYLGSSYQTNEQKAEMDEIFDGKLRVWRNLDFVAAWFALAARHVSRTGSKAALVTTNSICQGESVPTLWPLIHSLGVEIQFAHTSFKWTNSAAKNAGVTCAIIGLRQVNRNTPKCIYTGSESRQVDNINAYLLPAPNVIVAKASDPQAGMPIMEWGNKPSDGGNLILDRQTRDKILEHDGAIRFVRCAIGSQEFIRSEDRWCLWIEDDALQEARSVPEIQDRIEACRVFRAASTAAETRSRAAIAHRFNQIQDAGRRAIIVPSVCSERRAYLTVGFVNADTIITNSAFAIYDPPNWVLALLSTSMHMAWTKAVGGRLEDRIRYSNTLVYNTFPTPMLDDARRQTLDDLALRIIATRQPYLDDGRNIAWLYNPETMPDDLRAVHDELDEEFEGMYVGRGFKDDAERLEHLFRLYAKMKGR